MESWKYNRREGKGTSDKQTQGGQDTWNPVTSCSKVSEDCRNCYAKTFTGQFQGYVGHYCKSGILVTLDGNTGTALADTAPEDIC
jgi:protein gp37